MADNSMTAFQSLPPEGRAAVREVTDAVVEGLNAYADLMERGELEMMPGPQALRWVAAAINVAMIQQEDQNAQ